MTKLVFLGSGSAFTLGTDNFQSNMFLISDNGEKLLIDCGTDIRFSLNAASFTYRDVTDIYISHLHSDHIGGLEYVGFNSKFDPQCSKPTLYLSEAISKKIWDSLSGGMAYLQGEEANIDTFYNIQAIGSENYFYWQNIKLNLVKVIHVDTKTSIMPSYGLFFQVNQKNILITTDTQLCLDVLEPYYKLADFIFHDCEISTFPTGVHSHYQELVTLSWEIKAKMWLYGYQPLPLPNAKADGFLGFVKGGDVFKF